MNAMLTSADYAVLRREADRGAAYLVRKLRLPAADRDDLRHDLLVDLLARVGKFDPCRGSFDAFVAIIVKHCAARLATRLRRHHALFDTASFDEPTADAADPIAGTQHGGVAGMVSPDDWVTRLETTLSVKRAVSALSPQLIRLIADLGSCSIDRLCEQHALSRATLYRRLRDLRLHFEAAGIGPDA